MTIAFIMDFLVKAGSVFFTEKKHSSSISVKL